jgi:hypothetical protein
MTFNGQAWHKISRPFGSKGQYVAELLDAEEKDNPNGGINSFEAATDREGINAAVDWARPICQKLGKPLQLIVKGGTINGSYTQTIFPDDV